jgi:hypothetical protein
MENMGFVTVSGTVPVKYVSTVMRICADLCEKGYSQLLASHQTPKLKVKRPRTRATKNNNEDVLSDVMKLKKVSSIVLDNESKLKLGSLIESKVRSFTEKIPLQGSESGSSVSDFSSVSQQLDPRIRQIVQNEIEQANFRKNIENTRSVGKSALIVAKVAQSKIASKLCSQPNTSIKKAISESNQEHELKSKNKIARTEYKSSLSALPVFKKKTAYQLTKLTPGELMEYKCAEKTYTESCSKIHKQFETEQQSKQLSYYCNNCNEAREQCECG